MFDNLCYYIDVKLIFSVHCKNNINSVIQYYALAITSKQRFNI